MTNSIPDSRDLRRILGHYPTGVCAITALHEDQPVGMIVGSFTSVSLDPPLVGFLPDRKSTSWPKIEAAGRFCVNVLSSQQGSVCKALSSKAENKFDNVSYRLSDNGLPIFEGIIAWIECQLYAIHDAGDHYFAIGEICELDIEHTASPMIFFQGGYGSFLPSSKA